MRIVNIYKKDENGNKKFLNKAFFESKKGKWNIEENLKEIMLRQNHEDILKLGTNSEIENIGVKVFYFHDGIFYFWNH